MDWVVVATYEQHKCTDGTIDSTTTAAVAVPGLGMLPVGSLKIERVVKTELYDINADGLVVGTSNNVPVVVRPTVDGNGDPVYFQDGGKSNNALMYPLRPVLFGSAEVGYARFINNQGDIAGQIYSGTIWGNGGKNVALDGNGKYTSSQINDLNALGDAVGIFVPADVKNQSYAFVWSPSTGMHSLGLDQKAVGINNQGQVLLIDSTSGRAYVLTPGTDVNGDLCWDCPDAINAMVSTGSDDTQPAAINDEGQVAGKYYVRDASTGAITGMQGFLITPTLDGTGNLVYFQDNGEGHNALIHVFDDLTFSGGKPSYVQKGPVIFPDVLLDDYGNVVMRGDYNYQDGTHDLRSGLLREGLPSELLGALDPLTGRGTSWSYGVNERGTIVGNASNVSDYADHAVQWQYAVPPPEQPDLTVSRLFFGYTNITRKAGSNVMVADTVSNIGTAKASTFIVGYHLSTDMTYGNGDDIASASTRKVISLNAGASSSWPGTSVVIPKDTPAGVYHLCAKADDGNVIDESNEYNNWMCTTQTITVPKPDLVMKQVSTFGYTVTAGNDMVILDSLANNGGSQALNFQVGYVLSPNRIIGDSDDIVLPTTQTIDVLGVGAYSTDSMHVSIPVDVPSGKYWVGAIADVTNAVDELKEGNNAKRASSQVTVIAP